MAEKLAPNFIDSEFQCRCCGRLPAKGMKTLLIVLLQRLRDKVGKPLTVTSGYRCPKHNKAVGGVSGSQHMLGTAADIKVPAGWTVPQFAQAAIEVGFDGVGRYLRQGFIHVDVRGHSARWTN
jgi:uncharacterized protein YcbK (DUF882 family)